MTFDDPSFALLCVYFCLIRPLKKQRQNMFRVCTASSAALIATSYMQRMEVVAKAPANVNSTSANNESELEKSKILLTKIEENDEDIWPAAAAIEEPPKSPLHVVVRENILHNLSHNNKSEKQLLPTVVSPTSSSSWSMKL